MVMITPPSATAKMARSPLDMVHSVHREPAPPVLDVRNLSVSYITSAGDVQAVRDVSLTVQAGETMGIVGESGCGKSTLAFAVMGYLGENGNVTRGSIHLHDQDLVRLSPGELRALRGRRMAMVYQDPQTSLNPALVVGSQVAEAYRVHTGASEREASARAVEMLGRVGLPDPKRIAGRYPHQLSGGQQQRVVIAMALINDPALLIMDEPTTGLDVTTEALILDLVGELKREFDTAILYISHNLGVIAQVCDRVAVMYAGEVVEQADVATLFQQPRHPYTVGLLGCVPHGGASKALARLQPIPGVLPSRTALPKGCNFASRCELAEDLCLENAPDLLALGGASRHPHHARCHFWADVPRWAAKRGTPVSAGADRVNLAGPALPSGPSILTSSPSPPAAALAFPVVEQARQIVEIVETQDHRLSGETESTEAILEVRDLRRHFGGGSVNRLLQPLIGARSPVRAVDGVSFSIRPGETLALVGESGCGKTTLARTIAGLVEPSGGTIRFMGHDVACTADRRPPQLRRHLQMIFQNPDASLNQRHTVGEIVRRPVELFLGLRGRPARQRVVDLLGSVNLDPSYYDRYPRQLSGGEKQRVSIARAFAGDPKMVICDEAVSALDVSVQASILNLLVDLQRERGTSFLFISHDLSVVRYLADRVGVMYLGKIVDLGDTEDLFQPPYHPYTEALLSAIPIPDPEARRERIRLFGPVPSPTERPAGCPFASRCPRYLGAVCDTIPPPVQDAGNGHQIACHIPLADLARLDPADAAAQPARAGDRI
jgi:peptide/nickel transport system ATP-binding protein